MPRTNNKNYGAEGKNDPVAEIERSYYLLRAFNAINSNERSIKFIYQEVTFWREESEFIMEFNGRQSHLGDIYNFDEFEQTLLDQRKNNEKYDLDS